MASLKGILQNQLVAAMREKNEHIVSTLRMAIAAIRNEEIAKHAREQGLADEEVVSVLRREIKKRQDAVSVYEKAGDAGRADTERKEIEILNAFVPAFASREQVERAIAEVRALHPGATAKDFGMLMKEVMAKLSGNADGKMVSELLRSAFS